MNILTELKRYEEGVSYLNETKTDIHEIESGSVSEIEQGWNDLEYNLDKNPMYSDILSDSYSDATTLGKNTSTEATQYLQGISLTIEGAYGGTTNLMTTDKNGNQVNATMYDLITNPTQSFDLIYGYNYSDSDPAPQFSANWGSISSKKIGSTFHTGIHGTYYGSVTYEATGTASAWGKYASEGNSGNASLFSQDPLLGG